MAGATGVVATRRGGIGGGETTRGGVGGLCGVDMARGEIGGAGVGGVDGAADRGGRGAQRWPSVGS
ncbi:hypothetical protein P5G50_14720 [Leifsonia sp. F6_8S_P_1B]|uniref:Uncharacterized protein n=1 Tax=Leifsonia williamsii TaxID=3035919 RepID=A0ABT8KEV4_9MICO|nr:hypothetical protein [Leifsonia williamsii]MDN4615702.1 hypothetical protein [Leifsonia williamsii]